MEKCGYKSPLPELFSEYEKPDKDFSWQKDCVNKLIASFGRIHINAKIVYVSVSASISTFVFQALNDSAFKTVKCHFDVIENDLDVYDIRITEYYREYNRGIMLGTEPYFKNSEGIYGKPFMRINEQGNFICLEISSPKAATVGFKETFSAPLFMQTQAPCLAFPLGKNTEGNIEVCYLEDMPHLFIGGDGGSGKSIFLHSMIAGLTCRNSPDDVRFLFIETKCVEFSVYKALPHSLTENPVTALEHALNALNWAIWEMNRRFDVLTKARAIDIKSYNYSDAVKEGRAGKIPYIVIIFDEISDIILSHKEQAEEAILQLCQKGRAAGIHLVISTQRPSPQILSGTVSANIPSRIAFRTSSQIGSRVILDTRDANKLLGRGDMLFKSPYLTEPKRIQGCLISGAEIRGMAKFIKENNIAEFSPEIEKAIFG